jgi:hypothetical protein
MATTRRPARLTGLAYLVRRRLCAERLCELPRAQCLRPGWCAAAVRHRRGGLDVGYLLIKGMPERQGVPGRASEGAVA